MQDQASGLQGLDLQAIDVQSGFDDAFRNGIALLPKVGYFLLILIVGIFLAKAVQKILTKVLQRVGFDDLVERGGVKQALSRSRYDAATILARTVYYFIFLFVLSAAFRVFGPNPISDFLQQIIFFLPNVFVAVLVLVIAAGIAAAVKDVLGNLLGGLSYGTALANAASLVVVALGVFFALDQLQIAPLIVGGIFYALLALIVVPPIIAFGVGGIEPARDALRGLQSRAAEKAGEVSQQAAASSSGPSQARPAPRAAAPSSVTSPAPSPVSSPAPATAPARTAAVPVVTRTRRAKAVPGVPADPDAPLPPVTPARRPRPTA